MDILAASYTNIGPFVDDTRSVYFDNGTYLISAPIGKGKSFVFFDGPVFGLYKHSRRPILNRASDQGKVLVLFAHHDQVWAIERSLSPTKTGGESVRSRFFSSATSVADRQQLLDQQFGDQTIVKNLDLMDIASSHLEEVEFAAQRELDQAILDLLPPKEVLLSTNFLLQDAPNVFELAPAERVVVFKHLFGLLGIDEAKGVIAEKRREVQTTIKVKQDTSDQDVRLQGLVDSLRQSVGTLQPHASAGDTQAQQCIQEILQVPFLQDLSLLEEGLHIDKLRLDPLPLTAIESFVAYISEQEASYNQLQGALQQLAVQQQELTTKRAQTEQQIATLTREQQQLEQDLNRDTNTAQQQLLQHKEQLQSQLQASESALDVQKFAKYTTQVSNLSEAVTYIQQLQQQGALLRQNSEFLNQQTDKLQDQLQSLDVQLNKLGEQQKSLKTQVDTQSKFHCDKIEGDCPYVEAIKGASLKTLANQQEQLDAQIKDVEEQKGKIEKEIEAKKLEAGNKKQEMQDLADQLKALGWKEIIEASEKLSNLMTQIQKVDSELSQYAAAEKQLQAKKDRLLVIGTEIKSRQESLHEIDQQLSAKKDETTKQVAEQAKEKVTVLVQVRRKIDELVVVYDKLAAMASDRAANQLAIKQLRDQELQLKNLYQIFSKDLLFYVLQDFLPQLQELINTFLHQLVDYTVHFHLPDTLDEKMELNIEIHDEKGVRSVKSLSGGQLVMLKLVWILAVGRLMRVQFMFLDETVNNLDAEAISRVASVLEDYVTGTQLKLYVVTHSPQIQSLSIWERRVEI